MAKSLRNYRNIIHKWKTEKSDEVNYFSVESIWSFEINVWAFYTYSVIQKYTLNVSSGI